MKILFVTEFFPNSSALKFTGGVEARTYFTVKYFADKNQVNVICRKTRDLEKPKRKGNLFIYPCGYKSLFLEANFWSVFERLSFIIASFFQGLKLDFDVVEGSNIVTYLPAYLLGLVKNKPVIAWYPDILRGKWIKYFGITGFFGELLETIGLKLGYAKIIALSNITKRKLVKTGINPNKVEVIYGGVNSEFRFKNYELRIKRQQKEKNIICISRLVKYKCVGDLIKAFSQLINKYSNIKLTIIGQGPEEVYLKMLVNKMKLTKKVIFLKNVTRPKILRILKHSYIFCLPSIIEGFGLVTIEAAALGIPYVITDIDVNKEVTHDGKGGLLFKKNNINDLEKNINLLLTNKNLYQQKLKEGPILARDYNWQKIVAQTKMVYQEAGND